MHNKTKINKNITIGIIYFLFSCINSNMPADQIIGLSPINNTINLIGRTWLYERTTSYSGRAEHTSTTQAYAYISCNRDTSILGKKYFILGEEYTERGQFNIYTSYSTSYVHIGNDSVIIMVLDTLAFYSPVVSLYKKSQTSQTYTTKDKYTGLFLPFTENSSWYLRDTVTSSSNIKKKYIGKEIVVVPAGKYECHKIAWDWSEENMDSSEISKTDWVSCYGLIRSELILDSIAISNSWGKSNLVVDILETVKLLSYSSPMPTNIQPMLTLNLIDTLKRTVRNNWKIENYKKWLAKHIEANNVTNINELANAGVIELQYLVQCIWGTFPTELSTLLAELTKPLPSDSSGVRDYSLFLAMVGWSYEFIPGSIDCDLDIDSGETSRATSLFRFGNSSIRTKLMETLYN